MAQTFLALAVNGPAVAIPASSPHKTFVVAGDWEAPAVALEISADGINFDRVAFYDLAQKEPLNLTFSANWARAVSVGVVEGAAAPGLAIDTIVGSVSAAQLVIDGPAVDVSSFENKHKTFIVSAQPSNLNDVVIVEGSVDGGVSWDPLFSAQGQDRAAPYGIDGYLQFARARTLRGNTAGMRVDIVTEPFECGDTPELGGALLKFAGTVFGTGGGPMTSYLADSTATNNDNSVMLPSPQGYRMPPGILHSGRIRTGSNSMPVDVLVEVLRNGISVGSAVIPAGAASADVDITFSAAYSAGDALDVRLTANTGAGSLGLTLTFLFDAGEGVTTLCYASDHNAGFSFDYHGNNGAIDIGTVTTIFSVPVPAGTLSNFRLNVLSNNVVDDPTTFTVRWGAPMILGNSVSVIVPAGATGAFNIPVIGPIANLEEIAVEVSTDNSGSHEGQHITFSATLEHASGGTSTFAKFSNGPVSPFGDLNYYSSYDSGALFNQSQASLAVGYRMPRLFDAVHFRLDANNNCANFDSAFVVRQNGGTILAGSIVGVFQNFAQQSFPLANTLAAGDLLEFATARTFGFITYNWVSATIEVE